MTSANPSDPGTPLQSPAGHRARPARTGSPGGPTLAVVVSDEQSLLIMHDPEADTIQPAQAACERVGGVSHRCGKIPKPATSCPKALNEPVTVRYCFSTPESASPGMSA